MVAREEGWDAGIAREFRMDMSKLLYLKWITNKDLLYSKRNFAQCYVAAWMGRVFGREWIHVFLWLNPFTVHLKLLQHCLLTGYTPIQNNKVKKKEPELP